MKLLIATAVTTVVSSCVIMNAYNKKQQFYPTMLYLLNSSRTMSVLYIQAFLISWQVITLLKSLFFGTLRSIEIEHLIEKSWFAVLDTFILLAAFHEELSPSFVFMIALLFAVKSFHWLATDRVDHMEQSPVLGWKFHVRAVVLLLLLGSIDIFFVRRAIVNLTIKGLSSNIVFGLEYAIMLTDAINILLKYILHAIDLRSNNPWENKPIYIRYIDIILGVFELMLYVGYMSFMLMVPFIPLHIARRLYRSARDFQKSIHDVISSHRAIRNLNTLYPNATTEELQTANNVCIICRDEMVSRCKKLPCNHIFHTSCLRSWFQRQHTCPTCRMDVLRLPANRPHPPARRNAQQQQPQPPQPGGAQMMFPPNMMPGWGQGVPPVPPPAPRDPQPPTQNAGEEQNGQMPRPQEEPPPQAPQDQNNATQATPLNVPPTTPFNAPPGFHGNGSGLPPFPSFSPFMVPPPFPMATNGNNPTYGQSLENMMSELTEEQLHDLEGMERASVEARIRLLKNIQQLLDAAVLHMNQYTAIMSTLSPTGPGYHGYQSQPREEASPATPPRTTPPPVSPMRSQSLGSLQEPTDSLNFNAKTFMTESKEDDTKSSDIKISREKQPSIDISDSEMIRQRRLQRFHSLPVTSSLTSVSETTDTIDTSAISADTTDINVIPYDTTDTSAIPDDTTDTSAIVDAIPDDSSVTLDDTTKASFTLDDTTNAGVTLDHTVDSRSDANES